MLRLFLVFTLIGSSLTKKPNVVIFLADDMGWGDLGVNQPPSRTPNLDKLAEGGIRFTDFHAAASLCTPSRAALLTSRLGLRTGVIKNFNPPSVGGLPLNETTLAEILKKNGYKTALIGKWHLGHNGSFHPVHRGFDSYYGIPYSTDMGCVNDPGYNYPTDTPCSDPSNIDTKLGWPACPVYENSIVVQQPANLWNMSVSYSKRAVEIIRRTRAPFLLLLSFPHVHVPLFYKDDTAEGDPYSLALRDMDAIVGDVMSALFKTNRSRDTMVWFLSDNGPWEVKCEFGGNKGPYQGRYQKQQGKGGGGSSGKKTVWEGGHRVPAILFWPNKIKGGWTCNSLLSSMDIFPTVLTAADIPLPSGRLYDGVDMTQALQSRCRKGRQSLLHPVNSQGPAGQIGAVRWNHYKAVYYSGGVPDCEGNMQRKTHHEPALLFNLESDPAEEYPLNAGEAEYKTVMKHIGEELSRFHESLKRDNISRADYHQSKAAWPCCNRSDPLCRCS